MSEINPAIIETLQATICQSPYDWAQDKYHAFIYGILIGWSDEACEELARHRVLDKPDIERMNAYHSILNTRAPQEPQWRSIETAPKDGTFVLLSSDESEIYFGRFLGVEWDVGFDPTPEFTHWMPLPAPPEVTE